VAIIEALRPSLQGYWGGVPGQTQVGRCHCRSSWFIQRTPKCQSQTGEFCWKLDSYIGFSFFFFYFKCAPWK